jgi:hypothetical protein
MLAKLEKQKDPYCAWYPSIPAGLCRHAVERVLENPTALAPRVGALAPLLKATLVLESGGPSMFPAHQDAKARPETSPLASDILFTAFESGSDGLRFEPSRLPAFGKLLKSYLEAIESDLSRLRGKDADMRGSGLARLVHPMEAEGKESAAPGTMTLALLVMAAVFLLGEFLWSGLSMTARMLVNRKLLPLYHEAQGLLETLSFAETRESTGGLSFQGVTLGRKRTLAVRDLTLPGLTARYLAFVESIRKVYNGKVIIAIDELDKIHDLEQVKGLLSEIKGALFAPGCFYLVSLSEDAARSFRRRLASGRDIIESTFDDVIGVDRMDVAMAEHMIGRRREGGTDTPKLEPDVQAVAVLFAGGIPREIVRNVRALALDATTEDKASPGAIARRLFRLDVLAWLDHLGEVALSAKETLRLREHVLTVLHMLTDVPDAAFGMGWSELVACLDVLDPKRVRDDALPGGGSPAAAATGTRAIDAVSGDIQTCVRLMLLATIGEMASRAPSQLKDNEARIIQCHRTLADKPALAEAMVLELRSRTGLGGA